MNETVILTRKGVERLVGITGGKTPEYKQKVIDSLFSRQKEVSEVDIQL